MERILESLGREEAAIRAKLQKARGKQGKKQAIKKDW